MFEALCPYCQRYIANNLGSLQSKFGNQTVLELVSEIFKENKLDYNANNSKKF